MRASERNPAHRGRQTLKPEDYLHGILARDRAIIARAITLVESSAPRHQEQAQALITLLLPHSGRAQRIGITGVPGAGKSTLIETLGCELAGQGTSLAVLAVDPSSSISGGSILGDKTRMEKLCRYPNTFVRPSPARGTLGGVARKTRESILICDAAGFDLVVVETVGVGQSEIAVRAMVDLFLLLMLPGAGDELQGLKKGISELADIVVVNKADGENRTRALTAQAELQSALRYLRGTMAGWDAPVVLTSAQTGEGIAELWRIVEKYFATSRANGVFETRRRTQSIEWMHALVAETVRDEFYQRPAIQARLAELEQAVGDCRLTPVSAANELLRLAEHSAGTLNPESTRKDSAH